MTREACRRNAVTPPGRRLAVRAVFLDFAAATCCLLLRAPSPSLAFSPVTVLHRPLSSGRICRRDGPLTGIIGIGTTISSVVRSSRPSCDAGDCHPSAGRGLGRRGRSSFAWGDHHPCSPLALSMSSSSSSSGGGDAPAWAAAARTDERRRAGSGGYSIIRQPVTWDRDDDDGLSSMKKTKGGDRRRPGGGGWFLEDDDGVQGRSGPLSRGAEKRRNTDEDGEEEAETTVDHVDLRRRTLETLDYPRVLRALARGCVTAPARRIIAEEMVADGGDGDDGRETTGLDPDDDISTMPLSASSVRGVHARYAAVEEMQLILSGTYKKIRPLPLTTAGTDLDVGPLFDLADGGGRSLEGPDILEFATVLNLLEDTSVWCVGLNEAAEASGKKKKRDGDEEGEESRTAFVELPKLGEYIAVDPDLRQLLNDAFDERGRLSGETFPGVGRLRGKVRQLKSDILSTVNDLISSSKLSNKLALESGGSPISEVNGRIVVPVDERYGGALGIVHDASRSGKTVYVEPTEIVGPTNEMRQAEVELAQEEARVWRMLTDRILDSREEIEEAVAAAAQIDLVAARVRLGEKLQGVVPEVRDEGVMHLEDARHPVLLLRELDDVVGSDVDLGADGNRGLVLTGPNSGGKTIVLKLMGLVALMVRDGIPIPASPDRARVDLFKPVLADIGDMQSVGGDLSTFSGHMLVCREVLASSGENALVLMDELGSGTDPAQGVAIAQALLEALVDMGARVAITTHYLELKQLAAADDRFAVGGMQFVNGRPTYRLLPGTVGESFALAVAERLELPPEVIGRANELLDSDTRQMGDLIRELEDQKTLIDAQVEELERKRREVDDMREDMERTKRRLEQQQLNARRDEARKFAQKLEEKEAVLGDILERLKSDPSRKVVAKSWDDVRFVKRDALREAEFIPGRPRQLPSDSRELIPLTELDGAREALKVGDKVLVCKKGAAMGKEGTITKLGPKNAEVSVGSVPLRLKYKEMALPSQALMDEKKNGQTAERNKVSKVARRALAESRRDVGSSQPDNQQDASRDGGSTMRTSSNTLDLRGCNLLESQERSIDFFARTVGSGRSVAYLLHGHGTGGVLKRKLRDWLKREKDWVKKWRPADASDGGDAFTLVELKSINF